jgi:inner membrane protein
MMIGANLPDIDILSIPFGASLTFRRGITHGIPALIVLPVLLTMCILWWDGRRRAGDPMRPAAVPHEILLLSALSILTHPVLDFMNSYGMRWLMPMSGTWFYGDSLFIVDPWLLLMLGGAVLAVRIARRTGAVDPWRPARLATAAAVAYIASMGVVSALLRDQVADRLGLGRNPGRRVLMVAPVPLWPHVREVIWRDGDSYRIGRTSLLAAGAVTETEPPIPIGGGEPEAELVLSDPEMAGFLDWSRFPFFTVERSATGLEVTAADARYSRRAAKGWASVTVGVPRPGGEPRN